MNALREPLSPVGVFADGRNEFVRESVMSMSMTTAQFNDVLRMHDVAELTRSIRQTPAIEDLATLRQRADDDIAEYGKVIADAGLGVGK